MKRVMFGLALVSAFGLGFVGYRVFAPSPDLATIEGFLWPAPRQLSSFELTDHRGERFDLSRVRGHWTLWYFGYTHCPDVCPQALSVLQALEPTLANDEPAAAMQYLFVSVDPARDTPERLAQWVGYFSDRLIGAGNADLQQLSALTAQLGVFYLHNKPDENGDYAVDHTSSILLTDPAGRLVGMFPHPHQAGELAQRVAAIREFLANEPHKK